MPTDSGASPTPAPLTWPPETLGANGDDDDEALFYQSLIVFALLASLVAALLFYCLARVRRAECARASASSGRGEQI